MTDTLDELADHAEQRKMDLAEALQKYDIVSAEHDPHLGSYIILADRSTSDLTPGFATAELGYASPSPWTSWTRAERVPELMGRQGLRTYYDMKRADGTVRGALRLIKTPVMAARWFIEAASDSPIDKNIADFVETNLFEELSVPWSRVVEDALLMCDYGYMPFELVFSDTMTPGKLKLQKLAPRHPMDIIEWVWDDHGGVNGIIMEDVPVGSDGVAPYFQGISSNYSPNIPIPIQKLVIFVLEQEAGDLRGISILRSAYKHYYYKDTLYKIDAIQKERHGIGIPIIKLPPGFTANDKKLADELGRNLRTNERAHIVVPQNWEVAFAELKGQPVDCLTSINHHDMKIKSNILAPFMDELTTSSGGSFDVFYKSARYIANTVCDTFNHFVIPKLVKANFARGGTPKLRVRRIGEQEDIRTMSFSFRNFVGAGAITPDEPLEDFLRNELDLPKFDKKTARTIPTPQLAVGSHGEEALAGSPDAKSFDFNVNRPDAPGQPTAPQPGPPRQAKAGAPKMPKSNAGKDTSGGKG